MNGSGQRGTGHGLRQELPGHHPAAPRGDCWGRMTRAEPWRSAHLDRVEPCKQSLPFMEGFQVNIPTVYLEMMVEEYQEISASPKASSSSPGKGWGELRAGCEEERGSDL